MQSGCPVSLENMMKFKPFSPKQMAVLCWWTDGSPYSTHDAIICDGAVRSGKTLCMFISFVLWGMTNFDGCSFAVCGKTVSSTRRNITTPMIPILQELGFEVQFAVSKGIMTVSAEGKSNTFYLFGGRDEASASLIQGMTLAGVLFDEVALMPKSFVEQALARCSVEGSKFWFNCNPGHPSHWFYNEWIKNCKSKNALYLHFRMQENPSLSREMLKRYEQLYEGTFYERYVLGRWVAGEGLVYPMFDERSLAEPNGACEKYIISCDYGTVNPSSFGLWGLYRGVWYRIDEYYFDSRKEGVQRTDEEHYEALEKLAGERSITAVICDPSAASFMACIRKHGRFRPSPAINDVTDGIRRVCDALKSGRIKISPNCKASIKEFSLYRWDESAKRDAPRKENDHAMDDIRYFVSTALRETRQGAIALAAKR